MLLEDKSSSIRELRQPGLISDSPLESKLLRLHCIRILVRYSKAPHLRNQIFTP